jgi:hypothetical protein
MIPQVTAAALVSENKQRAHPASVDSIPTSANQEDHVSMAAHGARRSWLTEAPMRMLMNNLDPDVAENPQRAGRLWRHRPRGARLGGASTASSPR